MLRPCFAALLYLAALPALSQSPAASSADLIKQAEAAHQKKQFRESADLYTRALPLVDEFDRAGIEYNLACAQALSGDHATAFITLDHAVEDGYLDRKGTEADSDLASLHADPRWQPLLDRMSETTTQQNTRWGDAAFATPYAPNIADADKLAGLAELWAQARYGFANFWHVPKLNWDQTYRDTIPEVLATKTTDEYYRVLQHFYAQLEDGHSNVYTPAQIQGRVDRLPIRTRLVDGRLLVIGSRSPAADLQGLRPGDEIVMINDTPAAEWAQTNIAPYISASTPQDRNTRTYEYQLFLAPPGTAFSLRTQTPAGQQTMHSFNVGGATATHLPPFALQMMPGNVAHVTLNGFDDDTAAKEWDKHWPEISKSSALILDVRENGGGDSSVGYHILSTLMDKPAPDELSRSSRWIATYRAWGKAQTPVRFPVDMVDPDPGLHFSGPIVLLTSPRTYSAAEDMTVLFS